MNIFLEGPAAVKRIGPIEIAYYNYGGFSFEVFGRPVFPRRHNPLWVVARILFPEILRRKK